MSMPPTNQDIYSPQGLPNPHGPGPNDGIDAYYEFEAFQQERAYRMPELPPATYTEFLRYKQWKQQVATHPVGPPPAHPAYMQPHPAYMQPQPMPNAQQPPAPPPNAPPPRRRQRGDAAAAADADGGALADVEESGSEVDCGGPPKPKRYKRDCPLTAKGVKLDKKQLAVKNQLKVRIYLPVGLGTSYACMRANIYICE